MSLAVAVALAFSPTATVPACSWDRPGHDPFMGDVVEAVERYTNIPLEVRDRLKRRMAARQYDEIATIRRDSITGSQRYSPEIRDMHFGQGKVCRSVSRSGWSSTAVERGLVYCEAEHCIIVPTVCRNVSRITRLPADKPPAGGNMQQTGRALPGSGLEPSPPAPAPDGKGTALAAGSTPEGELLLDPPSMGVPGAQPGQPVVQGVLAMVPPASGLLDPAPTTFAGGSGGSNSSPRFEINPFPSFSGGGGGVFPTPITPAPAPAPPASPPAAGPGTPIDPPSPVPPTPALPPLPPVSDVTSTETPPIPEPGTWALLAGGLVLVMQAAKRRRRQAAAATH